jgi:hypothetical protein
MEVSGQIHAPAALPLGKEPPVPLDRLGGLQNRSGTSGEETNPCIYRESNPGRPSRSVITILTDPGSLLKMYGEWRHSSMHFNLTAKWR